MTKTTRENANFLVKEEEEEQEEEKEEDFLFCFGKMWQTKDVGFFPQIHFFYASVTPLFSFNNSNFLLCFKSIFSCLAESKTHLDFLSLSLSLSLRRAISDTPTPAPTESRDQKKNNDERVLLNVPRHHMSNNKGKRKTSRELNREERKKGWERCIN